MTHVLQHSEGVAELVEAITNVDACSAIMHSSTTHVGEFFGCWTGWSSPFTLTGEGFKTLLLLSIITCADMLRRVVFSCMYWWLCVTSTRSQANFLQGLRKGSIWCPKVSPMLFAASPSQRSGWRATPVFTPKLDSLFPPTMYLKLLSKFLMTKTISCEISYALSMRHRLYR